MEEKNKCQIVQDLLPNYIEKLTSEETNSFIDEHLKECENCKVILRNMNKNINIEELINQDEKIDYLKGYRKNKTKTIIFAILLTIIVMLGIFIALFIFNKNAEFFVNINDLFVNISSQEKVDEKNTLTFYVTNIGNKFDYKYYKYEVIEDTGIKTLHIKIVGKYSLYHTNRYYCYVEIDDTIEKVYLEDKKGNLKELWNKQFGNLI